MIPAPLAPLASHLWQSTVFAAVAGLLTLALRRNQARVRYWLWLAASYKFLLPFSLLVNLGHLFEWHAGPVVMPPAFSAVSDIVSGPIFFTASPAAGAGAIHPSVIFFAIWAVWACGFLTVAVGWAHQWLRIRAMELAGSPLLLDLPIRVVSTPARLEPGVFGIFFPVLLLPEGIAARLTQDQLQAVLAHELSHVRRRDNLTMAVHMLVEALFWFHPLVWWLGVRLIDERERACDEEVLRAGSQAQVYAESILKVCEFYLESPLTCISGVTGSDLKKRMERIMKQHFGLALSTRKKLLLAAVGVAALCVPLISGVLTAPRLQAQSSVASTNRPTLHDVSIRLSKPEEGGPNMRWQPGNFLRANMSVRVLIAIAYLGDFTKGRLVVGGPDWVDSEGFHIEAKPEGNPGNEQRMLLEQSLLEDRFKLAVHHETRLLPVYGLVLSEPGKFGPQLTSHSNAAECTDSTTGAILSQPGPDQAMPAYCDGFFMNPRPGDLRTTGNGITMDMLGPYLIQFLDRTVVNQTGLNGTFDFNLEFAPFMGPGSQPSGTVGNSKPSIFTAIREQLGLKLEPQTGPVDVIVIDHIEEPTVN